MLNFLIYKNYCCVGFVLFFLVFMSTKVEALTYTLPLPGDQVVGEITEAHVEPGDSWYKIARRHNVGFTELRAANPELIRQGLKPWKKIKIPSQFILPNVPWDGIVINLAEMRLYYFPPSGDIVVTHPVGVGREGWSSPEVVSSIIEKKVKPNWVVPDSIMAYMKSKGIKQKRVVPPGPDNPLGDYAMRLGERSYLIHGTNRPQSVGKRSSSGCIRMYPEDIDSLFHWVPKGTAVRIINEPYKVGWKDNSLFVEAHKPFVETPTLINHRRFIEYVIPNRASLRYWSKINWSKSKSLLHHHKGYPELIGEGSN